MVATKRRLLGPVPVLLSVALMMVAAMCSNIGPAQAAPAHRPNIVFILTDDLSTNLVTQEFMPTLWQLAGEGTSFSNYFVTDSLCCPSRASIFTGRYPHDTGVFANSGSDGGYDAFDSHGDEESTVATDLEHAGYRTAMMGKYLNKYEPSDPPPPGWDEWDVAGWGYPEFNYTLNEDGAQVHYGGLDQPGHDNYLTDVLSGLASKFITTTVQNDPTQPFFLEVASFAPHSPFVPARQYAKLYPGLTYPATPAFDAANVNPPAWLGHRKPLTAAELAVINKDYRLRAQDVKSVDDLLANVVATLRATGQLDNTYIVFSSDNGLHMGEHRLTPGKLTAFDTDIKVPLIVVGPGVPKGYTAQAFAQNIDLRSTFDEWAGTVPSETVDGRSLVPLLSPDTPSTGPPPGWPEGALIEHRGPVQDTRDPDYQEAMSANPPSYEALRLPDALYVEYKGGGREYYDLTTGPNELDNVYPSLSSAEKAHLHKQLFTAEHCHGTVECAAPFQPSTSLPLPAGD